jgi:hypothetical protein
VTTPLNWRLEKRSAFQSGYAVMLKSIIISVSAAIIAPIAGVSLYFGIHTFESATLINGGKSATYHDRRNLLMRQSDKDTSFAVSALRSAATAGTTLSRKAEAKGAVGMGRWVAMTSCADGQPARERRDCDPLKPAGVPKNTELADSKAHPKADVLPCVSRRRLPFDHQVMPRMTLGGPCMPQRTR